MDKQQSSYNPNKDSGLHKKHLLKQTKSEQKSFDTLMLEEERRYLDVLLKKMQTSLLLFN